MKDYSKYLENAQDYILSYKKEDGCILVTFADKTVVTYAYNIALEQRIIEKMKNQANEAIKLRDYFQRKFDEYGRNRLIDLLFGSGTLIASAIFKIVSQNNDSFGSILGVSFYSSGLYDSLRTLSFSNKLKDIDKLEYFFRNEQELNGTNEAYSLVNLAGSNIGKKTLRLIFDALFQGLAPVNLNNIDKFELGDLVNLKEHFAKFKMVSADSEEKTEEQGRSLTKEYNQNNR